MMKKSDQYKYPHVFQIIQRMVREVGYSKNHTDRVNVGYYTIGLFATLVHKTNRQLGAIEQMGQTPDSVIFSQEALDLIQQLAFEIHRRGGMAYRERGPVSVPQMSTFAESMSQCCRMSDHCGVQVTYVLCQICGVSFFRICGAVSSCRICGTVSFRICGTSLDKIIQEN